MMLHPAVTIHGLDEGRWGLATGLPVTLLSAPGAGAFAGVLWWRGIVARLALEFPAVALTDLLDCADAPGTAMAALRAGQRAVVLAGNVPAWPAVDAAARALGAHLFADRPESLDLAAPGARRRLDAWLRQPAPG